MKIQLFITILLALTLTNIAFAQDSIGDFLKQRSQSDSANRIESQAQDYFRAIVNQDAEGIYQFMNPNYVRKINNQAKLMKMIKDEFKLIQEDFKFISIKIKPGVKVTLNNNSPVKIPIQAELLHKSDPNEPIIMDGEITAISIDNKWYFFHKNYFMNSLELPGMSYAVSEDEEQVKDDEPAITPSQNNTSNSKTLNGGMVNGKAISLPAPQYPKAASAVGATGAVNVQVIIDESGNVVSAEAVSGHNLLRQAAVDAAKKAKFERTVVDGQARKVSGIIVYNFNK